MQTTTVISNDHISSDYYLLTITLPAYYDSLIAPGLYFTLKPSNESLPKPFSCFDYDLVHHTVSFYYRVMGSTTTSLQQLLPGDPIMLCQLLGKGFTPPTKNNGLILLLAAGSGIAPIHCWAKYLTTIQAQYLFLYNCTSKKDSVITIYDEVFRREIIFCDDDLSTQQNDLQATLQMILTTQTVLNIYACGPWAYLQNLAVIADQYQINFEFPI